MSAKRDVWDTQLTNPVTSAIYTLVGGVVGALVLANMIKWLWILLTL